MVRKRRLYGWMPRACFALALAATVTLGLTNRAQAQSSFPDTYAVTYFDVATSAAPSAAGYGGAGSSGGAGDNTVRLVNTTAANGAICAELYVFDDNEQLQACCGCPITTDGLRTLSTINNLTFNFGVHGGNLNAGVIKLIGSTLNFRPDSSGKLLPLGTNGCNGSPTLPNGQPNLDCTVSGNGTIPLACSPTGLASNDNRATAITPTSGLRAWISHDELEEPGFAPTGTVQGVSVEEFQDSPLDSTELDNLQNECFTLITNGSNAGFCTCGAGEDLTGSSKTKAAKHKHHHRH